MYTILNSFGLEGITPYLIQVEVDSRRGLPGFDIVGLPDTTVKESRDRIQAALKNLGYPTLNSKITVNLAPADKKKQGAVYDAAILLALVAAVEYEALDFTGLAVVGEVGLSGDIRPVHGILPMVLEAAQLGIQQVIVPLQNLAEAAPARQIKLFGAPHIRAVLNHLTGKEQLPTCAAVSNAIPLLPQLPDFADVKGQCEAKRALEVAAAGGHNLLMVGPPGSGKSMLAKRLPSILPPLSLAEAIETTKVYSVAGQLPGNGSLVWQRPFRAPHHSVSTGGLIGGGSEPKPGDLSLAHNGVLFLDEVAEFSKTGLEMLRQPLEEGEVILSRVKQRVQYPAQVMLVAAMNPCPCGYFGSNQRECRCGHYRIRQYLGKVSGPLLDRIDLQMELQAVSYEHIQAPHKAESSAEIRARVVHARALQQERYKTIGIQCNAQLTAATLEEFCILSNSAKTLLQAAFRTLALSARGYHRILKVARTVADLERAQEIAPAHISQAIQFRSLDRKYWNL